MQKLFSKVIFILILTSIISCDNTESKKEKENIMKYSKDTHSFSNPNETVATHLNLNIIVDFETKRIKGKATYKIKNNGSSKIIFDTKDLSIQKVTLGIEDEPTTFKLGNEITHHGKALEIDIKESTELVNIYYNTNDGAEAVQWLAGETQGLGNGNLPCLGPTGLRAGDTDLVEFRGCDPGDNNFLAPLNMIAGESYGLLVNNFSESGFGFSIEFGGTGEFLGPEPDFAFTAVDNFECDKTITFENLSISNTDDIVSLRWRFGEGAIPFEAMGEGPHDVIYDSFGPKVAVLTVETSRGCRVTKSLDIEVQSCCADQATLELTPAITDLSCFESADGVIMASAENGTPEYLYTLDGGRLLPTDIFNGLSAGDYTLTVLDMKGCEVSESFTINQPEEIQLTLTGPTDTVRLGGSGQITSDFFPTDRDLIYVWTPPNGLSCDDCPDPEVTPPGTTIYRLTVTDQDGCTQQMDILIQTDNVKPFYAPNIISLSASDVNNGLFKIFSNIAAEEIEDLSVFDRWGGEMYNVQNIGFEDGGFAGWDGKIQNSGRKVNPGVFVWVAKVRFIDGDVRTFAGDLTVVD